MEEKPEDVNHYIRWLNKVHNVVIDERYRTYYESVTSKVKRDLETSNFWVELTDNFGVYEEEYQLKFGYQLFIPNFEPELLTKSFESFLLKTYRKNILENESWPNEPEGGWLLPKSWFSQINDVVRTLLVVKYLDGVNFLKERIDSLCREKNMTCQVTFEAREEGYYAAHLYTKKLFEIPKITWDSEEKDFFIEIHRGVQNLRCL